MTDIYDNEGNANPVMLSKLIETAQKILKKEGDMPVWLSIDGLGYDDTIHHCSPMCNVEVAGTMWPGRESWWPDKNFDKCFMIDSW